MRQRTGDQNRGSKGLASHLIDQHPTLLTLFQLSEKASGLSRTVQRNRARDRSKGTDKFAEMV